MISNCMNPLLRGYFKEFLKSNGIEEPRGNSGAEINLMSSLYERFINYYVLSTEAPDAFTANAELLDFVSPGGQDDAKIDGFAILVEGRIVSSKEEILTMLEYVPKVNIQFLAIQTKMRPQFDNTEFEAFGRKMRKFFSSEPPILNDELQELFNIKEFIYSDDRILTALKSNPSLKLVYANIGNFKPDNHFAEAKNEIERLFKDTDTKGDFLENIEIEILDANKTRERVEALNNAFEVNIKIIKEMNLGVGENELIKRAVNFTCTGKEFLNILMRPDGSLRRSLFNANVRDYLGNGSVNSEIEKTMQEEPELFLICNNGITIVSSNYVPIKNDFVKITNPQIVNGCQTCNVLYRLKDKIDTELIMVSVRIICTDDFGISNKMVRSTNRQNQVLEEAFEGTRPFHQDLEKLYSHTSQPIKLYYERRMRQYSFDHTVKKTDLVNLRVLTQVFTAVFLEKPHEAHIHEAKLLERYARENRRIFKDDHNLEIYYFCGLLYYRLEEALRKDDALRREFKKYRSHLYYVIRRMVIKKVPIMNYTNKECMSMVEKLNAVVETQEKFLKCLDSACKIFRRAWDDWVFAGRSSDGIKDSADFTKILEETISIVKKNADEIQSEMTADKLLNYEKSTEKNESMRIESSLLRLCIANNGKWYAFIKGNDYSNNLYFDARDYNDNVRKLVNGVRLSYIPGKSDRGWCAHQVKIIEE